MDGFAGGPEHLRRAPLGAGCWCWGTLGLQGLERALHGTCMAPSSARRSSHHRGILQRTSCCGVVVGEGVVLQAHVCLEGQAHRAAGTDAVAVAGLQRRTTERARMQAALVWRRHLWMR